MVGIITGVDLSKILGGQTQLLWRQNGVKTDKCRGVPQLLRSAQGCAPKVYPYVHKRLWLLPDNISVHEISLMTSEIAEIYSNILDVFRGRCRRER